MQNREAANSEGKNALLPSSEIADNSVAVRLNKMPEAKLRTGEREFEIGEGVTTLGRTEDNHVSFCEDSNISRNHAEIELRGNAFWLTDLGSSNGTAVNGIPIVGETLLNHGDYIILGNSSTIVFELNKDENADEEAEAEPAENLQAQETSAAAAGNNRLLMVGATAGLAVALAAGAGAFYFTSSSSCAATAVIVKPEPGDTITAATEIEVDSNNTGCVAKAIFTIDGVEFAATNETPFTATIDPKDHPDLADGLDHNLSIVLIDEDGNKIFQPAPVLLAFETREIKSPVNTQVPQNTNENAQKQPAGKQPSLADVQAMSKRLLKQFSGNFAYNVSNKDFVKEVQKRTAEYAQEGYFDRAAQYRDAINVAFVREQNLDAPFGFMLAMSRSKFNAEKQGNEEGLFRMTNEFVTVNAYNGLCGTETISDKAQNCAAKAAALYMKSIVFGVFDGDIIYSAAAFGKSPQDAGIWKSTLPENRSDIWNTIKTPAEREQLIRFFAAGIVAENPQEFGLKKDRPLSELYRLAM